MSNIKYITEHHHTIPALQNHGNFDRHRGHGTYEEYQ